MCTESENYNQQIKRAIDMGVMTLVTLVMMLLTQSAKEVPPMAMPNCTDHCGKITMPYPFGMERRGCYKDEWFEINCTNGKTFLPRINMEVLNVSFSKVYSSEYENHLTRVKVQ